jgi:2'-5' RNA ligase
MMEQIRSFIAIELPPEIKFALKNIQHPLKSKYPAFAKWVNPDSIHLTLKFLGNVDIALIDAILQRTQEASRNTPPFILNINELGAFPNLRRVQVIWVGIGGEVAKLQGLQQAIESNLVPLGFPSENRPFVPHLTLARVQESAGADERQALGEAITRINIEFNLVIKVKSINLMRSQLTRSGAIYNCVNSIELKTSCQ